MGHNNPAYQAWVESAGYAKVKDLYTYDLDITQQFPPLIQRIVSSGERNARIVIRRVNKKRFNEEAELILSILNDAWARSEEHTSELQSLMRNPSAVFCLKTKK